MAAWLLVAVSLLFLSTTVNGQLPTGPLRPAPILSGALARELDQSPQLLELAAATLTRVLVVIEAAEQTTVLREGVNANIDCLPWFENFPGGTIQWFFQPRDVFGEFTEPVAAPLDSTDRTEIGGDFDRWLNITSTIIAAGAENPTQGNYICEVCIARGTPFEDCHRGIAVVHLLGGPPQLVKGSGQLLRTPDGGALDVNIGDNVCINRSVIPPPAINLNCEVATVDLTANPPILSAIPIPVRTYTFTDDEPGSEPVQIYNATDRAAPVGNPEFYSGLRALLDPATPLGGVNNFELTNDGSIQVATIITVNVTEDVLPGLLPDRDRASVQNLLTDQLFGTYTCTVENVFGSDTATTVISECGAVAVHPGCPAPVISPRPDNTAPIGCTVCIARGSTVILDCTVGGDNPRYRWTDSRDRLVSADSTLEVRQEGNFTCNATNDDTPQGAVQLSVVRFAPEISFSGEIRSTNFGARRDTGCERLDPPLMTPPDLCVFVGEMVFFTCVDQDNTELNVLAADGTIISNVTVADGSVTEMTFTCNSMMADDPCSNVQPTMRVQVFDPARISRSSSLGPLERGVGRSTSVIQVPTGDPVTIRCPISGVEDPSGVWTYYGPPNAEGVVNRTNAEDIFGVSIITDTATDVTLQIASFDNDIHGGMFVCRASNRAGRDEAFISLTDLDPNAVEWFPGNFGECNAQCNGGSRVRSVVCRRARDCNLRPNSECDATIRPASVQTCENLFPMNCFLTPIFIAGNYGPCSEGCRGGFRERDVTCVVPMTGEKRPRGDCLWSNQAEPRSKQFCFNRCCVEDSFDACSRVDPAYCDNPVVQQQCCWSCLLRVRY